MEEHIVVVGLGYVGLPVAVALADKFDNVVGFDISAPRINELQRGHDRTGEVTATDLAVSPLIVTDDPDALSNASFIIVTVPTPIDAENRPDLGPIISACQTIGPRLKEGALVVFESTVYPGVTEDVARPLLAKLSGLEAGAGFTVGYSPERINPGDKEHRLETIVKVIAAEDPASIDRVQNVYGSIIDAGLHLAPSIKVAEAAKVIENTQRDLNIALMNEFALIFDRMDIPTKAVLDAAGTKWNFLPFTPGLVGGHCIGVDPYYLTTAAERVGYHPEIILAGRRINNRMGAYVAQKAVKAITRSGRSLGDARVGISGLTFKPDVPDLRNSRVPDIIDELREFGIEPLIADAMADPDEAKHEFGIDLVDGDALRDLDCLIVAVDHHSVVAEGAEIFTRLKGKGASLIDVRSAFSQADRPDGIKYWSL